jgi:hypothetical protein
MKLFLAAALHMCSVWKPYLQYCWRTDPIVKISYMISIYKSCERFMAILTMLHVNNNKNHVPRANQDIILLYKI